MMIGTYTEGMYAGAAGLPRDESQSHDWLQGHADALANIARGHDPFDKPPNIPQLCAKDARLVCNCNVSSRLGCTHETYPPPLSKATVSSALSWIKRELKDRLK